MLALVAALSLVPPLQTGTRNLTVEQWTSGAYDAAPAQDDGKWLPDGLHLLVINPVGNGSDIDLVDAKTGKSTVLISSNDLKDPKTNQPIHAEDCQLSRDQKHALIFTNSKRVWRQNTRGDYWLWNASDHQLRKLGGSSASPSSLMFAKLSPDGSRVGYVEANNLYTEDLADGQITPLTTDGGETIVNGTSDWVYEEELDVRDAWRWSPDGKSIAYWQFDTAAEPIFTLTNDTDSPHQTVKQFPYPQAGDKNANVRIGVVSATGGPTVWMDDPATSETGYIPRMDWADDSGQLIIQRLNRAQNKNRYEVANAHTGHIVPAFTDQDADWIDIKDTGENGVRFVEGKRFLVLSEMDGWRHVYAIPTLSGVVQNLTPGNFDVDDVLGADKDHVYYRASPENATQRYLYVSNLRGSPTPRRVTPDDEPGTNEYKVSPTGSLAIHTRSRANDPPRHDLVSLPDHTKVRSLGDNRELRSQLHLTTQRYVHLNAADEAKMDACLTLPPNFSEAHKYPVLFFVYGEPAATIADDQWDRWENMFDYIVAQHGYIVARVDNRGTPSLKGRAWRKAAFHKVSALASQDQSAAAKQLAKLPYVDSSHIAVWGWSGGGSMTLSLLFRYPDIYRLGMAVAPVPDAHLYDSIYQERYLGMPQDNDGVYIEDSPLTFANKLKGDLLVVHGTGDDNVHFAGTERLVNALVADAKPFQLMVYPNRTHSLEEGQGTLRHLFELLLRYLTTHMPPR